ncbi:MAG: DNA mismatch repair protein MutS [Cyclobacteriaceae bacterium]
MSHTKLKDFFQGKIDRFQSEFEQLSAAHKQLSFIRVIVFLVGISLMVYAANARNPYLLISTAVLFTVSFIYLIKKHNAVSFKRKTAKYLILLNKEEIQRIDGNLSGLFDGDVYKDSSHPYVADLDIFGSNSLYQLVVRSRLRDTRDLAADWLSTHAGKDEILSRQQASEELKNEDDWRQLFTALGMHSEKEQLSAGESLDDFLSWAQEKSQFLENPIWKLLSYVMPMVGLVISILFIGSVIGFDIPYQVIFIPVIINAFLLKVIFAPLLQVTENFDTTAKILRSFETMILSIEERDFESQKLMGLRSTFLTDGVKASKAIGRLQGILHQLLNRINQLYAPLNFVFLLDLVWLMQAEKWKTKYGEKVKDWLDALYHIDLLNDMASMSRANPDFVNPVISDEQSLLETKTLGHPLIRRQERIFNDFKISGAGQVGLVTGSNMSGKSTFLRTVGINLVMAQAGLPVCAAKFSFSPVAVFTSMRTQDNLEEHISSFYAELDRIKQLLDSIGRQPIFFLLDEILKGTNSEDRHKGSVALIEQLTTKNASGLISTHDLTLSNLKNDNMKNYSFNSEIVDDEIIFDYKITNGHCKSFNASKLMEKMGIIKHQ